MERAPHSTVALAGLVRLLATGIGVIYGVILVRLGGPEIKGYASAFMAANSVLFAFANWDVPQGLLRLRKGPKVTGPLLNELSRVWFIYVGIATISGVVCLSLGLDVWVILGTLAFGLSIQTGGLLNGIRGPLPLAFSAAIQQIVLLASVLLLSAADRITSPIWVMAGILAAYSAATIFNFCLIRDEWGGIRSMTAVRLTALVRGGAAWQPTRIAQAALQRVDLLMVASLMGAAAAGFYSVAVAVAGLATTLSVQYSHKVIYDAMIGGRGDLIATLRESLLSGALSLAVLAALGWPALTLLYGDAFTVAFIPMLILSVGSVFFVLAQTIANHDRMTTTSTRSNLAFLSGGILMIVCLAYFIPRFDLVGAAVAYAIGSAVVLVVMLLGRPKSFRSRVGS